VWGFAKGKMQSPIIEVRNLVKRYRKAAANAVDGISFEVAPGEFFALLGPNGAGKTTTIAVLTTTLRPTSGTVRVAGHDVSREAAAVRRRVGIIFQKPSLDSNLTAEENVRFHSLMYGLYPFRPAYRLMPEAYRRQVAQLAEILGIERDIFKPVRTLSGGMRRKLEIVRSLMHRPEVLFLDEPTSGLDAASRRDLWEYLRQIRRESNTTILLTTHQLEEAESADSICIMNEGRVVRSGTPARLKAEMTEMHLLLDAAAGEREALRLELDRLGLPVSGSLPFKVPLDGRSVQQVIQSIQTPLSLVRTLAPTLEEAYLAIIEKRP
jgi:ABC-2 type transport system ATP-binding protein